MTQPFTIDDFIQFNEEVRSLIRAGLPLPASMRAVGKDIRGKVGQALVQVAEELEQGTPLDQAFDKLKSDLPPAYAAILLAGIRAGHLPAALESTSYTARYLSDCRQSVLTALVYPLIVTSLSYCFLVVYLLYLPEMMVTTMQMFEVDVPVTLLWLAKIPPTMIYWVWIPPLLLLLLCWSWRVSAKASLLGAHNSLKRVTWVPWLGQVVRNTNLAAVTELLKLLVKNNVPLHEALHLAAQLSNDKSFMTACSEVTIELQRGQPISSPVFKRKGFPALLGWTIVSGSESQQLSEALHTLSQTYQRRALRYADHLRGTLPTLILLALAATTTVLFGLSVFAPLAAFWNGLFLTS